MIFDFDNIDATPSSTDEIDPILKELFPRNLLCKNGLITAKKAQGDMSYIGILFGGSIFAPSNHFIQSQIEKYSKINLKEKIFEIIYISSDISELEFNEYYNTMPWLALSFHEAEYKQKLVSLYKCFTLPYLVILEGKQCEIITKRGVEGFRNPDYLDKFPFYNKSPHVQDIKHTQEGIFDGVCFILIQNYCSKEIQDQNTEIVNDIAKKYFTEKNGIVEGKKIKRFFIANGGGPVDIIRAEVGLNWAIEKRDDHPLNVCDPKPGNLMCGNCHYSSLQKGEFFRCGICNYNLCESCNGHYVKNLDDLNDITPRMFLLDSTNQLFWAASESAGNNTISDENIKNFIETWEKGSLNQMEFFNKENN